MTSRERITRCYFQQEMDRPCVWVWTLYPQGDASYDRLKSYIQQHADCRPGFNGTAFETQPTTTVAEGPHSAEFKKLTTTLRTPAGDLSSAELVGLDGRPGMHLRHFIESREDAQKYLSLPLPRIGGDVSDFFRKQQALGERGMVEARLGSNAAGLVAGLCGSESFAMLTLTDRDLLHEMCRRELQIILNRVKFLLARGVGPLFASSGPELVSPPLHGPEDFHDFNVRYDKPVFDLLHEAGCRVGVHCHGRIKKVLAGFLEAGVDMLNPFEGPPMGDITPKECKTVVRGRMGLEGNIQISRFYEDSPGSAESIREETRAIVRDCFDDRRGLTVSPTASPYIVGAGESSFANFQAMIDTVTGL